jgi:hypothetical protein
VPELLASYPGQPDPSPSLYTRAIAFSRIAALEVGDASADAVPSHVRFNGLDGFEELSSLGQRVSYVAEGDLVVDRAANAFLFFLPYLLLAPATVRESLELRMYTPDRQHGIHGTLDAVGSHFRRRCRDEVLARCSPAGSQPGTLLDRARAHGIDKLFDEFWSRTTFAARDDSLFLGPHADAIHDLENQALQRLVAGKRIAEDGFTDALRSIRSLVHAAEVAWLAGQAPPVLDRADVHSGLFLASRVVGDAPPFMVVNRGVLMQEHAKPKMEFVARPPTWADVVDGPNPITHFIERAKTAELSDHVRATVVKPLQEHSDTRLPVLFVVGAPGSGKSTLVRRIVAQLVQAGEIIAVDLGTNQSQFDPAELNAYTDGIKHLRQGGRPVVLVMDDPLFAGSGWDLLLKKLAKLSLGRGEPVAGVVSASPTFLMDVYGHTIRDGRIRLEKVGLEPPTLQERKDLAAAFRRDEAGFLDRDSDFIVLAMEAAAGISFDEIVARVWETLNDGIPISRRQRAAELPWPVRALLIVAFFHRYSAPCPEELLRRSLVRDNASIDADAYVHELKTLEAARGWTIFRIAMGGNQHERVSLITTVHQRIAERMWELRPDRAFDPADWIVPASVEVPAAASYLAQVAIVGRRSTNPADHRLTQNLLRKWSERSVPTWQLCRMVRELGPAGSGPALPALRARWRQRDGQSWLAVWMLIVRARRGSDERNYLEQVDMPACLRKADLSLEPEVAMRIAAVPAYRSDILTAVLAGLERGAPFRLHDRLVGWAIDTSSKIVESHLDQLVEWFRGVSEKSSTTLALERWYKANYRRSSVVDPDAVLRLLGEWIDEGEETDGAVIHYIQLLALRRALPGDATEDLVAELLCCVDRWIERNPSRWRVVQARLLLARGSWSASPVSGQVMLDTWSWLQNHPEHYTVRTVFLSVLAGFGAAPPVPLADVLAETRRWLQDHPDDSESRRALLLAVIGLGAASPVPLAQVLAETREWLRDHQENFELRKMFLSTVVGLGAASPVPLAEVLAETREWLRDHQEDFELRRAFLLAVVGLDAASPVPLAEVLAEMRQWLRDHQEDFELRRAFLLAVVGLDAASPVPLAEVLAETREWLRDHQDDFELRKMFLSTVMGLGAASPVPPVEVLAETREWLRAHPHDHTLRSALLSAVVAARNAPFPLPLAEVIGETQTWLEAHPDDHAVRTIFAAAVGELGADFPGSALEVLTRTRAWLRKHPDDVVVREAFVASVAELGRASPLPLPEVLAEVRRWVETHPGVKLSSFPGLYEKWKTEQE